MLKTSSETTCYDFFRPSKQKLWKNQRFLTSPRCNSAPPKGPKPCKKTMFFNTRSKIHCKLQGILAKSCYVQCFFHFWPFFPCRKATKMTQNSISIPSCAQIPKNHRKKSKTPPRAGLGAKSSLAPPPAKADIATAILTNVIEHLVLLLPPNKHAFTAKAVWADFCTSSKPFYTAYLVCLLQLKPWHLHIFLS